MRSSWSWLCFSFEVGDAEATSWAFEQELPSARMWARAKFTLTWGVRKANIAKE